MVHGGDVGGRRMEQGMRKGGEDNEVMEKERKGSLGKGNTVVE